MEFRLLADLVALIHVLFIVFVVAGAALVLRWRWLMPAHLLAVGWGAVVEFMGWLCPLTPLENWARSRAGQSGYSGGFIDHSLLGWIYPASLTRETQIALGLLVLAVNLIAYTLILLRRRQ